MYELHEALVRLSQEPEKRLPTKAMLEELIESYVKDVPSCSNNEVSPYLKELTALLLVFLGASSEFADDRMGRAVKAEFLRRQVTTLEAASRGKDVGADVVTGCKTIALLFQRSLETIGASRGNWPPKKYCSERYPQ